MNRKRVGIIGFGSIGAVLAQSVVANPALELAFVFSRTEARLNQVPQHLRITSLEEIATRPADLVVEAAHSDLVRAVATKVVQQSDLMLFSVTALAED
ncbi:MAG: NAD(P)-binding domain-containing protein, partial [Limisphaerales bacterium]